MRSLKTYQGLGQNKLALLGTNYFFSVCSFISAVVLTALSNSAHQNIMETSSKITLNPTYFAIVAFVILLVVGVLVNFVLGFFLRTADSRLIQIVKVNSWIPLFSLTNWLFLTGIFVIYKQNNDAALGTNKFFLQSFSRQLFIGTIIFCSIAIVMIVIALAGQLSFAKNGSDGAWFLTFAFWAIIPWSISVGLDIALYILLQWQEIQKRNLFLATMLLFSPVAAFWPFTAIQKTITLKQ